jgi:hypothetical protein
LSIGVGKGEKARLNTHLCRLGLSVTERGGILKGVVNHVMMLLNSLFVHMCCLHRMYLGEIKNKFIRSRRRRRPHCHGDVLQQFEVPRNVYKSGKIYPKFALITYLIKHKQSGILLYFFYPT